jgi:hypothetical protein
MAALVLACCSVPADIGTVWDVNMMASTGRQKKTHARGFLTKKLVSRFIQTPFGIAGIRGEVTNQFTGEFVDVDAFEVIYPLAPKVQNGRAQHYADVIAAAVEYVSVHGTPPSLARPRRRLRHTNEKSHGKSKRAKTPRPRYGTTGPKFSNRAGPMKRRRRSVRKRNRQRRGAHRHRLVGSDRAN